MKLAIFGGTFDPIHSGHLTIAREAVRVFGLERVLFVPAARPPHKSRGTCAGYEDRYSMVRLAVKGEPPFEASRLEAGQVKSYSVATIQRVKAQLGPDDRLFVLIGADAFAEVRSWYRWQEVVREAEFIVVARPGGEYETPPGARVQRLDTLALDVSSSEIRARLAAGETPPELPPAVAAYIREHGLYRGCAQPGLS